MHQPTPLSVFAGKRYLETAKAPELVMDPVERFCKTYEEARRSPTDDNLYKLLESLLPFSPAGIEWGLEVSSLAGVTYMLEDGKVVAVKLSRDEFGPFMQTSVAEIPLSSIPSAALKNIRDVENFVQRITTHLQDWASRMPLNNERKSLVEAFIKKLKESGIS